MLGRRGVHGTFAPMRRSAVGKQAAWLLLAVMMLVTAPRSLFHHCDEGKGGNRAGNHAMVQVDPHCPVCEAPAPLAEPVGIAAADAWLLALDRLRPEAPLLKGMKVRGAPRLRGPPFQV